MRFRKGCKGWGVILPVIAADRICKVLVRNILAPDGVKTAVDGLLSWAYCENTGAAFSMMAKFPAVMPIITIMLIAAVLMYLLLHPDDPPLLRAGLWMIAGGGLSNLFDRIAYGAVIDFIRLDFVNFAVFNPADIFVCTGAALVLIGAFFTHGKKEGA